MIQIKLDPFKTLMQNVLATLAEGDAVLFEFQTVPLDYRVKDRTTPTLFITGEKLLFSYDDLIEVFELRQLEMDILGEAPKFTPWQLWFEGKYRYTEVDGDSFEQLKSSTYYPRLTFNEKNQLPKEFALRSAGLVASSYQSWAMAQILINVKNGVSSDPRLFDLFKGDFAKYNVKTLTLFFAVFVVYTIIKSAFNQYGTVFGTILDILFGSFSAFILWWLYKSIEKNLQSYKAVYDSYQVGELNIGRITNQNSTVITPTITAQPQNGSTITNSATNADNVEEELVDAINQIAEYNSDTDEDVPQQAISAPMPEFEQPTQPPQPYQPPQTPQLQPAPTIPAQTSQSLPNSGFVQPPQPNQPPLVGSLRDSNHPNSVPRP